MFGGPSVGGVFPVADAVEQGNVLASAFGSAGGSEVLEASGFAFYLGVGEGGIDEDIGCEEAHIDSNEVVGVDDFVEAWVGSVFKVLMNFGGKGLELFSDALGLGGEAEAEGEEEGD